MIDLLFLIVTMIFAFLGMKTGALKQVAKCTGLFAGYLASKLFAPVVAPAVVAVLEWPLEGSKMIAGMACFYFFYVVVGFFARRTLNRRFPDSDQNPFNEVGGFFLGGFKAMVIMSVPIAVLLFFEKPIKQYVGPFPKQFEYSATIRILRQHNPIAALPLAKMIPIPALAKLQTLSEAAHNPPSPEALAADPKLKDLLDDPALKAALGEDSLFKALQAGDWDAVQQDPRVEALLKDPRIAGEMKGLMDLDKDVEESEKEAEKKDAERRAAGETVPQAPDPTADPAASQAAPATASPAP